MQSDDLNYDTVGYNSRIIMHNTPTCPSLVPEPCGAESALWIRPVSFISATATPGVSLPFSILIFLLPRSCYLTSRLLPLSLVH